MKKKSIKFFAIFFSLFLFIAVETQVVFSQTQNYQTDSNTVKTKVGNPLALSSVACPIPNGKITCGPSKPVFTNYSPVCTSGHCAGNYGTPQWCNDFPATAYASDVPGKPHEDVYIPAITIPGDLEPHSITCDYYRSSSGTYNPNQITTMFSCKDDKNGNKVWIQFSHILKGSEPKSRGPFKSGDPAAGKVDPDTVGNFPHTHVQIGINGHCTGGDTSGCVGSDKYIQCK